MNFQAITLILGIDREHLEELRVTWPTWMRFKPELRQMPLVIFYDPLQVDLGQALFLQEHPQVRFVPWNWPLGRNQREKMLTGWVHIPATEIRTPWYLKLDTDVVATGPGPWMHESWFESAPDGRQPVFISSVWRYSKPRYVIDLLDDWADEIPALSRFPRLDLPYSSDSVRVYHPRIISWFFLASTEWTKEVFHWLGSDGRLPHPSQDTFLFYCAQRGRRWFIRDNISQYRWAHRRLKNIRKIIKLLDASSFDDETVR